MTDSNNQPPKVMPTEAVVLEPSSARPDGLESVVEGTDGNSRVVRLPEGIRNYGAKVFGLMIQAYGAINLKHWIPLTMQHLVPDKFSIYYADYTSNSNFVSEVFAFDKMVLEDFMPVLEEHFGSRYFLKTDLAIDLPKELDFKNIKKDNESATLFPRIGDLRIENFGFQYTNIEYSETNVNNSFLSNPYGFLFLVEPKLRPFLAKAITLILEKEENYYKNIIKNSINKGNITPKRLKETLKGIPLVPLKYIIKVAEKENITSIKPYEEAIKADNLFAVRESKW